MKRVLFLLLIIILTGCSVALPFESSIDDYINDISKKVPQYMRLYKVPGVTVTLIKDFQIVWRKGYGIADREKNIQVNPDTIFRVASISKAVTAWGIMKLVEEGTLDLDTPVENYLSRWHLPESKYNDDGVTIRRLLSHSAGMPMVLYPGELSGSDLPVPEKVLDGYYGEEYKSRLVKRPGTGFLYSNSGYTLLQLIIEEVTGKKFEDYMQREILLPLGMTHSSFYGPEKLLDIPAVPYNFFDKPAVDFKYAMLAAGGLYSTGPDLAHFVLAGINGIQSEKRKGTILKASSIKEIYSPLVKMEGLHSILSDFYGLGHSVEINTKGQKIVSHTGNLEGWQSFFYMAPETGDGIIVLTNSSCSFPLLYNLAGDWARLSGIGGVKFSGNMHFFSLLLWIISGIIFIGFGILLFLLIKQLAYRKRELNLFGNKGLVQQIIKIIVVLVIILFYWLVIFPFIYQWLIIESLWLSIFSSLLAILFIVSFIFPIKSGEKISLVNVKNY